MSGEHLVSVLVSFGENWLMVRGGRRKAVIASTVIAFVLFYLIAFLRSGVHPFYVTSSFFLIVLSTASLGFWGGVVAGTITGILNGPLLVLWAYYANEATVSWTLRLLMFVLFGLLSGTVASIFRHLVRAWQGANERFIHAQKMEAIGRLTGGIAHDFNNMLTAIGGYAELLLRKSAPNPELNSVVDELLNVVDRSASLTHQLLAISRKTTMDVRPVKLQEGIQALGRMLKRIIGEKIELRLSFAEDLWEVRVDPVQIDQMLMNLALK